MKKVITYGLLAAFLASPFAMVSAASSNVAVPSSTAGVSQMDQSLRVRAAWSVVTKGGKRLAKTKRVQAAGAAVTGFVTGFFDGGDSQLLSSSAIPETALD